MSSDITTQLSKGNSTQRMRQWHELLQHGLWYASLPEELQHALLNLAISKNLSPGQHLMRRGDDSKGMYAILEGNIRVSAVNGMADKSSEMILLDLQPGHWFGEITLLTGARAPMTAVPSV